MLPGEHRAAVRTHLVVQLFVQGADVLLVAAPLAGLHTAPCGWQRVVNERRVVVDLCAPLVFRAQLLLLRNTLSWDI